MNYLETVTVVLYLGAWITTTERDLRVILYIYHMPSHAISRLSPTRLAEFAKVSIFPEACRGLYRHFQSRGLPSFENVDIA